MARGRMRCARSLLATPAAGRRGRRHRRAERSIIAAHGRHYTVELDDGTLRKCFPRGKKAGATVGDRVRITPQGSDEGAIDAIPPRRNLLYRSDEMRPSNSRPTSISC